MSNGRCIKRVQHSYQFSLSQCARKNGYGPNGAYCKQHDPEEQRKHSEASSAKYREGLAKRMTEFDHTKVGSRLFKQNPVLYMRILETEDDEAQ
jgi:hypothetical protein